MAISSEYSLADIAAATGNDRNNSGMWGGDGGTHGHASSYQSSAIQLRFAKNKQLSSTKGTGGFAVRFLFCFFQKTFQ